jgi:hypothetical protein
VNLLSDAAEDTNVYRELDAASTFSPFSTSQWLAQDENTEAYTACLGWPSPTVAQPPTSGALPLLPGSLPGSCSAANSTRGRPRPAFPRC